MFKITELERYAQVLLWAVEKSRKSHLNENDSVLISFHQCGLGIVETLYKLIIERKMHPFLDFMPDSSMERFFYEHGTKEQLTFIAPGKLKQYKNLNGRIIIKAPMSLTNLVDIPYENMNMHQKNMKVFRDIMLKRERKMKMGWTLCAFPSPELVKYSELDTTEYEEQIIKACFLDKEEPVKEWENIYLQMIDIKKWLHGMNIKKLHIESETIDLKITIGQKRKWISMTGHNIPTFEIFISPDYHETEGIYNSNTKSFVQGNFVENIELHFSKGTVVKAAAKLGESFLLNQIKRDEGAPRVGEFSLTDNRFSRINRFMANTLYDENFGGEYGNCHIALGNSFPESYDGVRKELNEITRDALGFNISDIHWDIINTEKKRVTAYVKSGKKVTIYENGKFTI